MTPAFNLRHISYFLAVAEYKSMSAAADALGLTQPSLSEAVLKLERHLDTRLAVRSPRGVEMTEAGRTLAMRGKDLLDRAEALANEVKQTGGVAAGELTVALPPTIGLIISVPLAETVLTELPKVRLHITEGMSRHILDQVENETAQIGCVYDIANASRFVSQPLLTEELFVITAPDNWPGEIGPNGIALNPVTLEELQKLPLVLPHNSHGARTIVERCVASAGGRLNVVSEIDALPHIIEMVERASAYSLLSQAAVLRQVERGSLALVPIKDAKLQRTAYLVRKWSRPLTVSDQAVQATIISVIAEMIQRYSLSAMVHPIEPPTDRP
ncbi:LysR family transcriptional regulator [Antarctobacter sp.]|uniref:LysR family transcriptional regulator n=1 Tax=Antarctobacter sp. TaxID=1872577 RepID=UPI003A92A278